VTADRRQGASSRIVRTGTLAVLAGGIVLGLFPTLALAADAAPAPSDPAAGTSTAPDPAATGGASTDPAQPATNGTEPTATTDPTATTTTDPAAGATTDPAATSGEPAPTTDPATGTAPTPPDIATGGPVACSSATAEAAAAGCPTLVLEQAQPAPPPEQPPAQAAPAAPAPTPAAPPAAPAAAPPAIVTHITTPADAAPGPLAPLHGTVSPSPTERPLPVVSDVRPVVQQPPEQAPSAPAPVLIQAAPLLAPELPVLALSATEPRPDSVVLRPVALHDQTGGAGAPILRASLEPLLKSVATHAEHPAEERSTGLGSTGGDEPLPLPPRDPSDSPTGLGAPSSGGGQHGSTGIFAIVTALVLLFVPRMVRRLPRVGAVAPRVGYRLVLERPG
jgi:hypothetical protein